MTVADYRTFLENKRIVDPSTGFEPHGSLPAFLKPHQADITRWAIRRGRAAVFAGTGLGKTMIELVWADEIAAHTGKPVLIFAPLAVSAQHIREALKFGLLPAPLAKTQADIVDNGVYVTNYQKMQHFDMSIFGGIVLDESSILKSETGHYRTKLIAECSGVPFRLAATATPAPNDFMELGNHAEFLGVMSYTDMLATFFTHDGGETQKWRLKGHAEDEFWKWMASWAVMLRKPSDIGYPDDGYDLPPLNQAQHTVGVEYKPNIDTGLLFPMEARSLRERISARKSSVDDRAKFAFDLVFEDFCAKLPECLGNQNTKQTVVQKWREIRNMLQKSNHIAVARQRKTKNICIHTTETTKTSGQDEPANRWTNSTQKDVNDTQSIRNLRTNVGNTPEIETGQRNATLSSNRITGSQSLNMTKSLQNKEAGAPSADRELQRNAESDCTSIIVTTGDTSEESCAAIVTSELVNSETASTECSEQSNICEKMGINQWIIWCQLNHEQNTMKKLFGELCISIDGSQDDDEKEALHASWLRGDAPVLLVKPSMFGHGLNWQHCHQMAFLGLNDSFEQVYQAIRRCWRFGQAQAVNVHFIVSEMEGAVVANLKRKELDAERMASSMVVHMADLSSAAVRGAVRTRSDYDPTQAMVIPEWLSA